MGVKTPPNVNRKLLEIEQMGLPALREKFRELYGYPTNIVHAQTLRKRLAYRVQELFYGGLSEISHKELNVIADTDPAANVKVTTKQETVLGHSYAMAEQTFLYSKVAWAACFSSVLSPEEIKYLSEE